MKKKYTKPKSAQPTSQNNNTATQDINTDADKALTTWLNFVKYSTFTSEKHAVRMSLRSVRTTTTVAYNIMENCHIGIQAVLLVCACMALIFDTTLKEYMGGVGYNIMMTAMFVASLNMWLVRFIIGMIYTKISSTLGEYIDNYDAEYDEAVRNYTSANTNS
jgi:hypothetical protein